MKEITQPVLQSLYRCHPQAYFLVETVMHQASGQDWEALTERLDVADAERLDRAISWQVRRADRIRLAELGEAVADAEFRRRYGERHKFKIYGYKQVQAELSPSTFTCRKCGFVSPLKKKIESGTLTKEDLICQRCNIPLKQIVHVFGHSRCGQINEIGPRRCPDCKQPFSLHLDSNAFGRSYWICPNRHRDDLSMYCNDCAATLGGFTAEARMRPYAAAAAVKPVALTMVDIGTDVDWQDVAKQRLAIQQESLRDLVLAQYEGAAREAIGRYLDSGEMAREQMYAEYREKHPEAAGAQAAIRDAIGGEPEFQIQRLLSEYYGVSREVKAAQDPLDPNLRSMIRREYHLDPHYIPSLHILQMVYGYQVGSSNLRIAKVRTFDRGPESAVLAHRTETEAALFDLDAHAVSSWLARRLGREISELDLQKMLMRPETSGKLGAEVYGLVETLLHTLAHIMIRQSELFTGLSREDLSEMVFPPALAFAIYSADGSELGALRSAFASYRLYDWLGQSAHACRECALDPSCVQGKITGTAACHVCLHIAERSCNGYWNEQLDRRVVSDVRRNDGFWDS